MSLNLEDIVGTIFLSQSRFCTVGFRPCELIQDTCPAFVGSLYGYAIGEAVRRFASSHMRLFHQRICVREKTNALFNVRDYCVVAFQM